MADTKASTAAAAPELEVIPIDELIADSMNSREHPDANRAAVEGSFGKFGAGRSVALDKDGVVRAGNQTLLAAKASGIKEVVVVKGRRDLLVAVKRKDWTDDEAKAYAIADNRSGDLSRWAAEQMAANVQLTAEAVDYRALGFSDRDMTRILGESELDTEGLPEGETETWQDEEDDEAVSHVKMVQLVYDEDSVHTFRQAEAELSERYGTDNITDTVIAAMREATEG